MNRKMVWFTVTCVVALGLLMASCAPTAKPTATTPAQPTTPTAAPTVPAITATATAPAKPTSTIAKEPTYGGTINMFMAAYIYVDPYRYETESPHASSFAFEKMAVGDWAADRAKWNFLYEYMPLEFMKGALVEKWEFPQPDTYIFRVRQGVRYHNKPPVNGREFTADDVVWNLERSRTSPFQDHEYHQDIASIKKVDKYTVELKLKRVRVYSPINIIDTKGDWMIAPEVVGKATEFTDWKLAIGTGPFMIEEFVPDSILTFKKNPDYWGYDELHPKNRLPYADGVRMLIIVDPSTQLAALRTGKVDRTASKKDLEWQDAEAMKKTNPQLLFKGKAAELANCFKFRWDMKPYSDVRVRQAVNMAIDREELVKQFFGGYATPYSGIVHPAHQAVFTPYDKLPDKPISSSLSVKEVLSYNPEKAKKLLAEAGYPNGFKTVIETTLVRDRSGLSEVLQSYLSKIGIQAEIKTYEVGVFNNLRYGKKFEQLSFGWNSLLTNPLDLFKNFADPNHMLNAGVINDPVFLKKWDEANVAYDTAKRNEIIKWLDMYSLEQSFCAWFPHDQTVTFWQPWLGGYNGEGNLGIHNCGALTARLWVDQDLKKKMTSR